MKGVKKLDNRPSLVLAEQNNCFLIDWLTFTAHGESVSYIKWLLGLDSPDIPWEEIQLFRSGYPIHSIWNGITISYGADDAKFYSDPSKIRSDMGICVNLSGTGCRSFETYGHGNWFRLFSYFFRDVLSVQDIPSASFKHYNITRLDLAYDDHIGLLDIYRMEQDVRSRYYVSRAKFSDITWSDNQNTNIRGLSIYIGSPKSDVRIRIYDKAAERGFSDRHWIRCELQLRDDRALTAVAELVKHNNIGRTTSGILRNYLTFREPNGDSNPSRWPISEYWDRVLLDMEKISLWISPGEPYNFSNTEHWLCKQYGQAIVVLDQLHDSFYLLDRCKKLFPISELSPKYKNLLADLDSTNKPFDLVDCPVPFDEV